MHRRHFLRGLGAGATACWIAPRLAFGASPPRARLVVVLLRGGLDALHALPPVGDAAFAALRGTAAAQSALRLDDDFGLHPALKTLHGWYGERRLLPVVAVAPPYRARSHFDAQDCLENGSATPGGARDGWLNRALSAAAGVDGLTATSVMPLILRGDVRVDSWSPPLPRDVNPILLQRLQPLYAADPALAGAFDLAVAGMADADPDATRGGTRLDTSLRTVGGFLADDDGPRVAFVEDSGWDTHGNQAGVLQRKLAQLDAGLAACRTALAEAWNDTTLLVVSEFGRTAAMNGTGGTDHGTGGVAFVAGGRVRGGRIAGDWPGVSAPALNEGRDLRATTDLRALCKAVVAGTLGLDRDVLDHQVFPDSRAVPALANVFGA